MDENSRKSKLLAVVSNPTAELSRIPIVPDIPFTVPTKVQGPTALPNVPDGPTFVVSTAVPEQVPDMPPANEATKLTVIRVTCPCVIVLMTETERSEYVPLSCVGVVAAAGVGANSSSATGSRVTSIFES